MNTRFIRDVQFSDPIGGNEGDRLAFNANLEMWLQRKPTAVSFTLERQQCSGWQPTPELIQSAKMLIGLRGFPRLVVNDRDQSWSELTQMERYGLLITAAACRASNLLARIINDGQVTFMTSPCGDHAYVVTLGWAETTAAWFVDQFTA